MRCICTLLKLLLLAGGYPGVPRGLQSSAEAPTSSFGATQKKLPTPPFPIISILAMISFYVAIVYYSGIFIVFFTTYSLL